MAMHSLSLLLGGGVCDDLTAANTSEALQLLRGVVEVEAIHLTVAKLRDGLGQLHTLGGGEWEEGGGGGGRSVQ